MDNLEIAIVQSDLIWEDIEGNLSNFDQLLWDADADVIVLPEMFTTGFTNQSNQLAVPMDGAPVEWMHDLACRLGSLLMGSMIIEEGGHYYNRLICAFPDGSLQYYDKRHLFSLAHEDQYFTAGKEHLLIDYNGWKIFPLICYDLRFPVWSRNIELADLMVFVASWPEKRQSHWDVLLKARAIENQCYVAGVNRVGEDKDGIVYSGSSAVYDFWGNDLVLAGDLEGVFKTVLSKPKLQEHRDRFGFWRDRDKFTIQ
ncbi:MAG TPA: amidohydrolase [Chitinophagales bacterium]|nr:amidohydrolase [Chitinophagales bacterium]